MAAGIHLMTMGTDIEHLEHCSQNVMKYANG